MDVPTAVVTAVWRLHVSNPSYRVSTCNDDVVYDDFSQLPKFLDGPRIAQPRVHHTWGTAIVWPKAKSFRTQLTSWDAMKWRPLNSYFRHRFARIYADVGRASGVLNEYMSDHFSCMRISSLFHALASHNRLLHGHAVLCGSLSSTVSVCVHDIGNLYPSCPRVEALAALHAAYNWLKDTKRYRYVNIPRAPPWPVHRSTRSRLYPSRFGSMRCATATRLKPFFSTNANYLSCRTYTIEDIVRVVEHDLAFSYTRVGGVLFYQREGFSQGSHISPGLANLFAADRERAFVHSLSPNERHVFSLCFVRRWMDDRLLILPPVDYFPSHYTHAYSSVVSRLMATDFYHEHCVLELDASGVYVGCDIHVNGSQVSLSQHNPNADLLTRPLSSPLAYIRYIHAHSAMSDARKANLLYGHLLRVLDFTMRECHESLVIGLSRCVNELTRFGFSRPLIHRQLTRVARHFPALLRALRE